MSFLFKLKTIKCWVEGGGWKVEGGRWRVEGRGWKVEGGRWRVEGGGWRVPRKEEMMLWFTVRVTN